MTNTDKPLMRIGFQLPEPEVYDVTGYCAAQIAVDAHNASNDATVRIELTPVIDHRDPATARQAAEAFVDDPHAIGMLGPINSDMALVTQDIYHQACMAQVSSEASSPELTRRGYDNFFRLVANDEVQGRALARAAVGHLKAGRIAVLSDNTGWGKPIAEIFAAEVRRLGGSIVHEAYFGQAEQRLDFNDYVEQAANCGADLIYFAVYWNKAHIITHRLRDKGVKATFLGSDALKPYAFLEVPILDTVSPYHSLAGIDMRLKPSARAFFDEFAKRYPMMLVAPQYAAEAYDAASLLIAAANKAGTPDRQEVLKALRSVGTFQGAIGDIRFDEHGDLIDAEIGFYTCKDGLRKYLGAVRDLVPSRN